MGGQHIHGHGSGDDGYDEDGYDESQRAEILEATRDGPSDGTIIVDLDPDIGEDDDLEDEDELTLRDGQVGETDATVAQDDADVEEDEVQEDFDDDDDADDDGEEAELTDRDDAALRP